MTILEEAVKSGRNIDVLCIGSPHVCGDAIGPMVGTILERRKVKANVIGTLREPVVRSTYHKRIKNLRDGSFVVVVDAGIDEDCPSVKIYEGPTYPGAAVSLEIKPVGHLSIVCFTGRTMEELINYCPRSVRDTATSVATDLTTIIGYI